MKLPKKLQDKLLVREQNNTLRALGEEGNGVDFSSNDYLGFSTNSAIYNKAHYLLNETNLVHNGATGSRLISGNHALYKKTEDYLETFHKAPAALLFNSGYDANVGLFSAVPQRGDIIIYDEWIHASIRDGIQMSHAKSYKYEHNNLMHLASVYSNVSKGITDTNNVIYVVTEAIFSMDGDMPDLAQLVLFCNQNNCRLIVDEAHAVGIFGDKGSGSIQELKLENDIFARVVTFGKALGCHGAVILGSQELKTYLVNFARSLIYTTALPPHAVATILASYQELEGTAQLEKLKELIEYFNAKVLALDLSSSFIASTSAIHCCVIKGADKVKNVVGKLQNNGFIAKAILSPTVPVDKERIRICLHSYNTKAQIDAILEQLAIFAKGTN